MCTACHVNFINQIAQLHNRRICSFRVGLSMYYCVLFNVYNEESICSVVVTLPLDGNFLCCLKPFYMLAILVRYYKSQIEWRFVKEATLRLHFRLFIIIMKLHNVQCILKVCTIAVNGLISNMLNGKGYEKHNQHKIMEIIYVCCITIQASVILLRLNAFTVYACG